MFTMFTSACSPIFTQVYSCLPMFACAYLFTRVYPSLPLFTLVYLFLVLRTKTSTETNVLQLENYN